MIPRRANDSCSCIGQCGQHELCNSQTPREYESFCYWCAWLMTHPEPVQIRNQFADLPLFAGAR